MGLLQGAALRKAAIWGAMRAPLWFVRSAPVAIGLAAALLLRAERARVRANLRSLLGARGFFVETRDVFATFVQFAQNLTGALAGARLGEPQFEVVGAEILTPLRSEAEGFIVGTCHVGAWDFVVQRSFQGDGRAVLVVMGPEEVGEAERVHDQTRDGSVRVVRVGRHPLDALPVLRHLQQGGIVATQLDRPAHPGEVRSVERAGVTWLFAAGPFRLAALAGRPIVPVFTARLAFQRYFVRLEPPIFLGRDFTVEELDDALDRLAAGLERHLRRFPTQWFRFR